MSPLQAMMRAGKYYLERQCQILPLYFKDPQFRSVLHLNLVFDLSSFHYPII